MHSQKGVIGFVSLSRISLVLCSWSHIGLRVMNQVVRRVSPIESQQRVLNLCIPWVVIQIITNTTVLGLFDCRQQSTR